MSTKIVSGYWLVDEGTPVPFLNYDGCRLRRCKRCKGICYTNQDAQKKHWKRHKKVCKEIDLASYLTDEEEAEELMSQRKMGRPGILGLN